ncbi:MAG: hypothetical protein ABI822_33660 [Bryobacteraceae bacterium]
MNTFARSTSVVLGACLVCSTSFAQMAISARSGMVHYSEGEVAIAGQPLDTKFGHFPDVKEGQVLTTTEGRAEILLTPGVFLRVSENSSIKMISSRLIDTRVELLSGSMLVECAELQKDNSVTFIYKDAEVAFHKKGLMRIDSSDDMLRVYDGEALVTKAGETLTLKEGKETLLSGVISPEKFDNKIGDPFYRWASRRAGDLAVANLSAAKSLQDNGGGWLSSGWMWNPMFGSFTYIPYRGYYNSPFGYNYYSPSYVVRVYESIRPVTNAVNMGGGGFGGGIDRSPQYNSNLGYNTATRSSPGYSAPAAVSSGAGNAAAASAPAAGGRGADTGGGRSSGGRGR